MIPNPGMDFTPFATLPAASLDDLVENIESLAAGTGLATNALYLGRTQLTSTIGPVSASTTDVDVTGLSVTVTVPAGGRTVMILAEGGNYEQTGGIDSVYGVAKIKEGSTVLSTSAVAPSAANIPNGWHVSAILPAASAGSHTYKVAFAQNTTGPNYSIGSSAVSPTFIAVFVL